MESPCAAHSQCPRDHQQKREARSLPFDLVRCEGLGPVLKRAVSGRSLEKPDTGRRSFQSHSPAGRFVSPTSPAGSPVWPELPIPAQASVHARLVERLTVTKTLLGYHSPPTLRQIRNSSQLSDDLAQLMMTHISSLHSHAATAAAHAHESDQGSGWQAFHASPNASKQSSQPSGS